MGGLNGTLVPYRSAEIGRLNVPRVIVVSLARKVAVSVVVSEATAVDPVDEIINRDQASQVIVFD